MEHEGESEAVIMLSEARSKNASQIRALTSSDESVENYPRWPARRVAFGSLGAVALAGCVVVAICASRAVSPASGKLNARMLLDHSAVHAVASDNLFAMNTVGGLDQASMRVKIGENIRKIGVIIDTELPELGQHLRSVPITEEQTKAVLRMMQHTKDARLQAIGLDIGSVIRDANTTDSAALRLLVEERLRSRKGELEPLVEEIMPSGLVIPFSDRSSNLDEILEPSRVKLLKTASEDWADQLRVNARALMENNNFRQSEVVSDENLSEEEKMRKSQQVIGSIGAATEEVMAIFRIIRPIVEMFEKDLDIPPLVVAILGALDFALEVTSCALGEASRNQALKSIKCPLLFASAGFDALREVAIMMGYLDSHATSSGQN